MVAVAILAVATLALLVVLWIRRKLSSSSVAYLRRIIMRYTPQHKFKIVFVFYQIATRVPSVYEVSLPADIVAVLDTLSTIVTFGLENVATTPLECMKLEGYVPRLLFWMALPVGLTLVIVGLVLLSSWCRRHMCANLNNRVSRNARFLARFTSRRLNSQDSFMAETGFNNGEALRIHLQGNEDKERVSNTFEKTLRLVLLVMFVLYPKVTNVAFEGFPCFWFEAVDDAPKRGWLRADVSIECNTPEHEYVKLLAWVAVLVYPIGMWLGCFALLRKASTTIFSGKSTPFSRSVSFLYACYRVPAFWWELMEMLRKFLLIGLFVTVEPGTILQIFIGTVVSGAYFMIQMKAQPYLSQADDLLAQAASWCLLMLFFSCVIYKYDSLTASDDLQDKMSSEQRDNFIVSDLVLTLLLVHSVFTALLFAGGVIIVQMVVEVRNAAKLRRLKYVETGLRVECKPLFDPQAYHLFLSHAWPAAQDRMRAVKARLLECLPSCRTFLDVDDLKSGSGLTELDKSGCILVFCTVQYFEKRNSLTELYRAVCKGKHILAMLEPDVTQQGGLDQVGVQALITNTKLNRLRLDSFELLTDEADVRNALFETPPVEWNRLPHLQDVTIRLIAQRGVFYGRKAPASTAFSRLIRTSWASRSSLSAAVRASLNGEVDEMYLQDEMAHAKLSLPPPLSGRKHHLFCSEFNAGALALAKQLKESNIFVTKGKRASAALTFATDVNQLAECDHMLILLDERTWTSGADTAKLVEHIHKAMRIGVHICCVHELPAVVGSRRHACDFVLMFNDDWTPAHLTGGRTNLYKAMDLALKGEEWRQPGLVALAAKLATSPGAHMPIQVRVPTSYEPKTGANPWTSFGSRSTVTQSSQALPESAETQANVSYSRASSLPSEDEVELTSMSTATPAQPVSVDINPGNAVPLPRPRPLQDRRRDEDVRDEMRLFGSCGTRDHPPTHRTSARGNQIRPQTRRASQESDDDSRASVVGRARADSLAEEPSACWLAIRLSSSATRAPGASEPGAARASEVSDLSA